MPRLKSLILNLRSGATPYGARVLRAPYMIKILGLEHLTASMQPEVLGELLEVFRKEYQKHPVDVQTN